MKPHSQPGPLTNAALSQAMDELWARFLPDVRQRVSVLEATAQAAREGKLTAKQSEAAQSAAHKLAGVLGTFGLMEGTALARGLERTFASKSTFGRDARAKLAETVSALRSMIENRKPSV
jgi:HPt (histidine-containing phosphotransfer) domain-containing protein